MLKTEEFKGRHRGLLFLRATQNFVMAGHSFFLVHPWLSSWPRSRLVPAHPALVNAIVLVLHSVAGSTPLPGADSSSRSTPSSSYRDMPGESQESVLRAPLGAGSGPGKCFTQQLCIALAEGVPRELSV